MVILRFVSNIPTPIWMEFAMDGILIPLGICICSDPSNYGSRIILRAYSSELLREQGGNEVANELG